MTGAESVERSGSDHRLVTRSLQLFLVVLALYGLVTLRLGAAANAGTALAVTLFPALLRREYGYTMDAGLVALITVAVSLHVVGILGPYRWVSWYDEITHTVSAALVAGIGYAVLRAFERHSDAVTIPRAFRGLFIVVFVLAVGVVWELLEFAVASLARGLGIGSPLVVYGIGDIVTDIVFNAVGALVVVLWGTEYFRGLVPFVRQRLRSTDAE